MSLRDYQQTLADKVIRASASDTPPAMLGFESGDEYWLVDLADAGEVLPVPALSEVPLTQPWFLGIANIRGTLYSVTDLAAFHGGADGNSGGKSATPIRAETRLLLAGARFGSNTALLMSRTQGLKSMSILEPLIEEAQTQTQTQPQQQTQPWRGERYHDSEGRTWTRLLLPALLNATQFLDIVA